MDRRKIITSLVGLGLAGCGKSTPNALRNRGWIGFCGPETRDVAALFGIVTTALQSTPLRNFSLPRLVTHSPAASDDEIRQLCAREFERGLGLFVATTTNLAKIGMRVSQTLPIVFSSGTDPIQSLLVKSYESPGGNATGFTEFHRTFEKRTSVLLELTSTNRIGLLVLVNPDGLESLRTQIDAADLPPQFSRQQIRLIPCPSFREVREMIKQLPAGKYSALVYPSLAVNTHKSELIELLNTAKIPTLYFHPIWVEMGGLCSYSHYFPDYGELYARFIRLIDAGVNPGDIPIVQPQHFRLCLNPNAARKIGLSLTDDMLKRADRIYP